MSAIQSRSVRSDISCAPQPRIVRATSARCSATAAGEIGLQLSIDGELTGDPGFGVLQHDVADVRQFDIAGIEHFDGQHFMAGRDRAQRTRPVDRPQEVADDHRHPATAFRPAQRVDGRRQIAAHAGRRLGHGRDGAQHGVHMLSSGARRHASRVGAVGNQRADSVTATDVEVRDGRRSRHREIPLLAHGGTKIQAGRKVDDQPGLQFPVGDHLPDVRVRGARSDRPVHPADVVAGLVHARLPRLRTRPRDESQVIAVQDAVQFAADGQLECTQRRRQLRVVDVAALHRRRIDDRRRFRVGHRPLRRGALHHRAHRMSLLWNGIDLRQRDGLHDAVDDDLCGEISSASAS